jgi:hypothetical protein
MTKNEPVINQDDPELCSFILLEFPYRSKLILPIADALEIVKMISRATQLESDYGEDPTLATMNDYKLELKFMSRVDINSIKIKNSLKGK